LYFFVLSAQAVIVTSPKSFSLGIQNLLAVSHSQSVLAQFSLVLPEQSTSPSAEEKDGIILIPHTNRNKNNFVFIFVKWIR
jgi:hypothetical protein